MLLLFVSDLTDSDIETLELRETVPRIGTKTNGMNMGPILKGHFKTDMGKARLFLCSESGPVIIIQQKEDETVMINFSEPEETIILTSSYKQSSIL